MSVLPRQWAKVEFEDICGPEAPIIYGILQPGPDTPGGVPYVRPTEIDSQGIQLHNIRRTTAEIAEKYRRSTVQTNDLLLSIVGTIGKVAIVPRELDGGNITQSSCRIRPDPAISDHQYLAHYLRSPDAISQYNENRLGTAVPRLNLADVRKISAPIPPLPEQRRIVAKLDRLSAHSAAARDHLAHTTTLAIRAKQAVLASAFSGEMTASWRSTTEISEWKHRKSSEVCDIVQSGGTPKKDGFCVEAGVPFLKVYNIVKQKVAFDYKPQFITEEAHNTKSKKSKLKPGDVLMNIVGPPLGKVAIVPNNYPEWNCNQAITVFRPGQEVTSAWIYHFLCSGISVDSVVGETRGVVGQVNISLTQCRNFVFPIPPKNEQTEIIHRIDAAFARIDRLTGEATRAAHLVDRLDERLLAKAFAGELVPQDPNDEPAEALLSRIREARAAAPKPTRGRKKKASV
jgi:type I restriction enzyme S subunit